MCWLFYFIFTVLFLGEKNQKIKAIFKSASLHFSHAWKICILEKQATEVILVGWFGKCQSIKKVGGRRFVEGLYEALFSFRLARRHVITKRNENWDWSQVNIYTSISIYFSYILNSGGIPSMAHWHFWLSPSTQLVFFLI